MIAALVAVFIVSGAAGLIYESIWSRYLGLFVGHSAYAQIIVLVIFLGGMSLGAHLASRWSGRWRSPLLWYAGIEFVVGAAAAAFHDIFGATTSWAYASVFPAVSGASLVAIKWTIAGVLILPQSVLLGATFPLMSAGVIRVARAAAAPGRLLATLYFANSIGAAGGVLLAGLVLIEWVGLEGTLLTAGLLNMIAALVVVLIARTHDRQEADERARLSALGSQPADIPAAERVPTIEGRKPPEWRPLLIVAFGTAVASFVYEIAWIRMLSLVLGSATHSFELMLSAFILGLALGSLWVRRLADRLDNPVRFLAIVQWLMGLLAVATLPLYVQSFDWMASVLRTLQQNDSGYRVFFALRYLIALLVMLPATFCAGMTLPLITRVLMRGDDGETGAGERAIGTVYAVNTLGSIVGVIIAGLVLMPLLGLKRLLVFGAVIDIALGVWLIARSGLWTVGFEPTAQSSKPRARWQFNGSSLALPVIATAAFLVIVAVATKFDLARITSGVYRHGVVERGGLYTFPFYKDGRTATVSVRRGPDGHLTLATNGKPDASMEKEWLDTTTVARHRQIRRDIATQLLLPIISLAHLPTARDIAVIGFGSGMTSHVLLGSPNVREIVTIEIEPEMIHASRAFSPSNIRAYNDPRSTFVIDDAKSYFASSGRKFDIILSEPSNPWVSGVSGLFTQEFYARAKQQLRPNGIFCQWLHLYELSDGLATSVIAAVDATFKDYEVFFTSNSDVLIVAADHAIPKPQWNVIEFPGVAHDLRTIVPFGPESFETLRLGGREVLHPIVVSYGAPNSDYFPVLDLGAERQRYMRADADGYINMSEGRFDVAAALSGRRVDFGRLGITPTPEIARPVALALGTKIRAIRSLPPSLAAQVPRDEDLRAALYRVDQLERMTATPRAPADWHSWMFAVVRVDEDLHAGTAGVIDSGFFRRMRDFAANNGAPAEARAGVEFLEGIGSWNWPKTAVATQTLLASKDSVDWIPEVLLRNGGAVAYTMLGDTTGAKKVLQTFARRTGEDYFRERMISSFLVYQDTTLRRRRGWQ